MKVTCGECAVQEFLSSPRSFLGCPLAFTLLSGALSSVPLRVKHSAFYLYTL